MATFTSFQEIKAWQVAHKSSLQIYKISKETPLSKDFSLKDQMCRCAVSVPSNIAEGFERGGKREFKRFLVIAKSSNTELRSQLVLTKDLGYITETEYHSIDAKLVEVSRMISGLIGYLNTVS